MKDLFGKSDTLLGFERFWKAWPRHFRKVGKANCRGIWKRRKLEAVASKIIAALKYTMLTDDWQKDGKKFIPMPATWLNQARYDFDPDDLGLSKIDEKKEVVRSVNSGLCVVNKKGTKIPVYVSEKCENPKSVAENMRNRVSEQYGGEWKVMKVR